MWNVALCLFFFDLFQIKYLSITYKLVSSLLYYAGTFQIVYSFFQNKPFGAVHAR